MNVKLIFWIIVGIIWLISVIAKKRSMETKPPAGRDITGKPGGGDVYEASEDELSRFLRMISGETVEEKRPKPEPGPSEIPEVVKETKPVHVEPAPVVFSSESGIPEAVSVPAPETVLQEKPVKVEPQTVPRRVETAEEPREGADEISLSAFTGMSMGEVRKGIVLSEILGSPRAMRPYR